MLEEEIKKQIKQIIDNNRCYFTKKQIAVMLNELASEYDKVSLDTINDEIKDITDYAFDYINVKIKTIIKRYYINNK